MQSSFAEGLCFAVLYCQSVQELLSMAAGQTVISLVVITVALYFCVGQTAAAAHEGGCEPNPCKNEGRCNEYNGNHTCSCGREYKGAHCEHAPCESKPCKNEGTCYADRYKFDRYSDEYFCYCTKGFAGKNCEREPCKDNPCQNGAECLSKRGYYRCKCTDGYYGSDCELKACSPNPCQNDGNCTSNKYGYWCKCKEGFSGGHCETNLKECDERWSLFGNSCYLVESASYYPNKQTWEGAQAICKEKGGKLVSINSREEAEFIQSKIYQCSSWRYWIGYGKKQDDGNFQWIDESKSSYKNWAVGKPTDKKEHKCAYIQPYYFHNSWVNGLCSARIGYICEKAKQQQ